MIEAAAGYPSGVISGTLLYIEPDFSTVANWAASFLVSTFFLTLTGAIAIEGTFWLYAGFGVAAIVFFAPRLPETKNRSLEEISEDVSDQAAENAT